MIDSIWPVLLSIKKTSDVSFENFQTNPSQTTRITFAPEQSSVCFGFNPPFSINNFLFLNCGNLKTKTKGDVILGWTFHQSCAKEAIERPIMLHRFLCETSLWLLMSFTWSCYNSSLVFAMTRRKDPHTFFHSWDQLLIFCADFTCIRKQKLGNITLIFLSNAKIFLCFYMSGHDAEF